MPHPIILYDGVCGLCNRVNQFVMRRDPEGVFRFAALQSEFAVRILARHGVNTEDLDTVYVVVDYGLPLEELLPRSDAAIFILRNLRRGRVFYRMISGLLQFLPRPLRDWGYRAVSSNRYRVFGRAETCMLPSAEMRDRFLDL